MLSNDVLIHVLRPALQQTGTWCPASEMLVYGTGWIESHYDYLVQLDNPKNGGLGFWQTEPTDYADISVWLRAGFNKGMLERVLASCFYTAIPADPTALVSNIKLAALYCRLHYWRIKAPLPEANDAEGLAYYHWKWYNGAGLGKTDKDKNSALFRRLINGEV